MKLLFYLWWVMFLQLSASRQFRNDYTYYPAVEGWLKLHNVPVNWSNAWLKCFREGAVLLSPETENLLNFMVSHAANLHNSCGVYTGIHATFSKGDYYSIEGTPLSKMNITWAPGEPDNFENHEDCLLMLQNGTVADVDCNGVYPFFCYRKKTKQVINGCGTMDLDYALDARTGSCYKFHRSPQNWTQAFAACSGEGGHLAIINSDIEATVIRELYSKSPDGVMPGNFEKHMAYVGVTDWGQRGLWLTIHALVHGRDTDEVLREARLLFDTPFNFVTRDLCGQLGLARSSMEAVITGQHLKAAGYDKWTSGYPLADTGANLNRPCGAVLRDALLVNSKCDMARPFICEKAPDSLLDEDY